MHKLFVFNFSPWLKGFSSFCTALSGYFQSYVRFYQQLFTIFFQFMFLLCSYGDLFVYFLFFYVSNLFFSPINACNPHYCSCIIETGQDKGRVPA